MERPVFHVRSGRAPGCIRRAGKRDRAGEAARGKGERKHAAAEAVRHRGERVVGLRKVGGRSPGLFVIPRTLDGLSGASTPQKGHFEIIVAMESILDAIGNTPLVRLRRCAPANGAELWVKLEYCNPSGSMKDRMALAMIEGAERDGLIAPGDTIVEYTGGSTGPALALVCRAKGYRTLIVIADCYTEERFQLMRALGAELEVIESIEGRPKVTPKDIENMVARAKELAQGPGRYATDQFNNPYIIPGHRDYLGREIWEQTGGPGYRVLPGGWHGQLADRRRRGAEAARRVHSGARAGFVSSDRRRAAAGRS